MSFRLSRLGVTSGREARAGVREGCSKGISNIFLCVNYVVTSAVTQDSANEWLLMLQCFLILLLFLSFSYKPVLLIYTFLILTYSPPVKPFLYTSNVSLSSPSPPGPFLLTPFRPSLPLLASPRVCPFSFYFSSSSNLFSLLSSLSYSLFFSYLSSIHSSRLSFNILYSLFSREWKLPLVASN